MVHLYFSCNAFAHPILSRLKMLMLFIVSYGFMHCDPHTEHDAFQFHWKWRKERKNKLFRWRLNNFFLWYLLSSNAIKKKMMMKKKNMWYLYNCCHCITFSSFINLNSVQSVYQRFEMRLSIGSIVTDNEKKKENKRCVWVFNCGK